jgi:hypothetical protein
VHHIFAGKFQLFGKFQCIPSSVNIHIFSEKLIYTVICLDSTGCLACPDHGPPEDPFLPLTNDIAFPRNITSAKTVYPGLNKS